MTTAAQDFLRWATEKSADLKSAVEVTGAFARVSPRDPVRYDFCLTRLGINPACRDDDLACLFGGA